MGNFDNVSTISSCIKDLLDNKLHSDIEFNFTNSDVTIHGHKFIIGLRSSVFHTMFYGSMASTTNETCTIEDIKPMTFYHMMQFIYTDSVDICERNFAEIMYAAHKYSLNCLEKRCCDFAASNLNADNCCSYLQKCFLFNNDLTEKCLNVIDAEIRHIMQKVIWKDLDESQLIAILRRDTLDVSEGELFEGVLAWAKHSCEREGIDVDKINIRDKFIVFELVRFPTMSHAEFAMFHRNNQDFLESVEIADIFQYINAGTASVSLTYSTVKRRCKSKSSANNVNHRQYKSM